MRIGPSARSMRCRSRAASPCSGHTGSPTWDGFTARISFLLNPPQRAADSTACSSPPQNSKARTIPRRARPSRAPHAFWATNGTSTSNKIILQALLAPGDIALIDRNCHKSHHYASVLAGAQPLCLEAYPMKEYSMYGAVPLRSIKKALLDLEAEGKLHLAKLVDLTNCTFDGHMYNPARVMEECLAIKPDLAFLWDEAWFGFARFNAFHRRRTAMGAAAALTERFRSPAYRQEYAEFKAKVGEIDPKNKSLLE